jgi:AhpD family alkylhydroperoxidase
MHTISSPFYRNPLPLLRDLGRLILYSPALLRALAGGVPPARRERLMLAVSAVNGCPYCLAFHTRLALKCGLSEEEVEALVAVTDDPLPPEDRPAVLYAREWARRGGRAEGRLRADLVSVYGPSQARQIEALLHLIWIGNLLGLTYQRLASKIPFLRRRAASLKSPSRRR